jgi:AraC family transcriptional activator of pobA
MKAIAVDPVVPTFFLYGEPTQEVDRHFLHLEPLADRSEPNGWNIRAHAHHDLSHLFFVASGGGEIRCDQERLGFSAPAALIVPARSVHAFTWHPDTEGWVLTLADTFLAELTARDRAFARVFASPAVLCLDPPATTLLARLVAGLGHELAWTAPAHAVAVESQLLQLLVLLARSLGHTDGEPHLAPGSHAELVARFRVLVEERFRHAWAVSDFAHHLGVTVPRLRAACLAAARRTPIQIIQDRLLLEAKRILLYSNMSIGEAAAYLGFDDNAYFSRFFTSKAGVSPRAFRQQQPARH